MSRLLAALRMLEIMVDQVGTESCLRRRSQIESKMAAARSSSRSSSSSNLNDEGVNVIAKTVGDP